MMMFSPGELVHKLNLNEIEKTGIALEDGIYKMSKPGAVNT